MHLKYRNSALHNGHEAYFHSDILFSAKLSNAIQAWRQEISCGRNYYASQAAHSLKSTRKRAPNLSQWQRLFFVFLTSMINPKRLFNISRLTG